MIVVTIDRVISSCTAKTSSICRSNVSDQRVESSSTPTRRAVTRRRAPARRTLASRTNPTPSRAPISWMGTSPLLKANVDVRDTTRRPSTFASAFINSSVMPSPKYSASASAPRLAMGRTAMERRGVDARAAGAAFATSSVASKACTKSVAEGNRLSGFFSSERATARTSDGDSSALFEVRPGAGFVMCCARTAIGFVPVNGGRPASAS